MSWNYRIVRKVYKVANAQEEIYTIHEAYYYEGKETPYTITNESLYPTGKTLEELKADLEHYMEALTKPVLEYDDF